jgi:FkbH-like protein
MKLAEALQILRRPVLNPEPPLRVYLACGFTPLHLQTFLGAHLRLLCDDREVNVEVGLYGDCLGNLERLPLESVDMVVAVVEWPDLDSRLGLRQVSGWYADEANDILNHLSAQGRRLYEALLTLVRAKPVALALMTLPLPPIFPLPSWQAGPLELQMEQQLSEWRTQLAQLPHLRLISRQSLDMRSPPAERRDVRAELVNGFPYRLAHAATLAELLARLVHAPTPKKGLITDLDNTLWSGILGEEGPENVSWDLDHRSQMHALYQRMLSSLSQRGVLVAAASKNDPALVQQVFQREDLLLRPEQLFPLEVHWAPKSQSVSRILRAWNIAADCVVFVDDSPLELAEVKNAFPEMECLLFPSKDEQAVQELLVRLQDSYGKAHLTDEDRLRLQSLRQGQTLSSIDQQSPAYDAFLRTAEAEITLEFAGEASDTRIFELVNKTNQFNLNGKRYTESEWQARLRVSGAFLLVVSYRDKFGPLGKIAVLGGHREQDMVSVDLWVLSCRAFSRRIEHRCLEQLFRVFEVPTIILQYQPTSRNGPLQEFLAEYTQAPPASPTLLDRQTFQRYCPTLYHNVRVIMHEC